MTKDEFIEGRYIYERIEALEKQIKQLTEAFGKVDESTKLLRLKVEVNDLSSYGDHYPSKEFSRKFIKELIQEYSTEQKRLEEELFKI